MQFDSIQIAGSEALKSLTRYRAEYRQTGVYPFLIGDQEDLDRLHEVSELSDTMVGLN